MCPFASANVVSAGMTTPGNLPESVAEGQNGLSLNCTVSPNGDGYDIQLDASLPGSTGGEFTATGHVTVGSADGLSGGGTVNAQFVSQSEGQAYLGMNCPVTYQYLRSPIAPARASFARPDLRAHLLPHRDGLGSGIERHAGHVAGRRRRLGNLRRRSRHPLPELRPVARRRGGVNPEDAKAQARGRGSSGPPGLSPNLIVFPWRLWVLTVSERVRVTLGY